MKKVKKYRRRVIFERAEITVGYLKIESKGTAGSTKIFLDGKEQMNIKALRLVCTAHDPEVKLYLDVVPSIRATKEKE